MAISDRLGNEGGGRCAPRHTVPDVNNFRGGVDVPQSLSSLLQYLQMDILCVTSNAPVGEGGLLWTVKLFAASCTWPKISGGYR
jgi:hypothetical protein